MLLIECTKIIFKKNFSETFHGSLCIQALRQTESIHYKPDYAEELLERLDTVEFSESPVLVRSVESKTTEIQNR